MSMWEGVVRDTKGRPIRARVTLVAAGAALGVETKDDGSLRDADWKVVSGLKRSRIISHALRVMLGGAT